eukprot:gene14579-17229_t
MEEHKFAVGHVSKQQRDWQVAEENSLLKERAGLINLFHKAYEVAKLNIPLWHFPDMCLSDESLFLDDDLTTRFNLGAEAYRNRNACRDFIRFLSGVLREDLLTAVKASPAYALGVDESNDVGNIEEMVIYAWFILDGKPCTRFLGLVPILDGGAESITQAIFDKVKAWELPPSTFVAFGSDGCSVMTGADNGVAVRLRREIQLALGFQGATTVHSDVVTRWLSKGESAESIFKLLPALEKEFRTQSKDCVIAATLHKEVTSFTFLATLAFHKDLFDKLNKLSVSLQKDTVDFEFAMGM